MGAPVELEERLAELERQRSEGSLSEIGYNLRRNLLITRSEDLARRRAAARVVAPRPAVVTPRPSAPRPAPAAPKRGRRLEPDQRRRGPTSPPRWGLARRGWARLASRPAVMMLAAAVVVGIAVFAVYRASNAGATPSATAPHPQGGAAAAGATAGPSQSAAAVSPPAALATVIDATQTTPGGGTVTLLSYADHFASGSSINNPLPPGGFYAAVDLRVCAGTAGSFVSPFQFALVEPGQAQVGIATGPTLGKQPELSVQQLPPGACVTGWLSYGVAARPTALDDSGDSLTWPIPG